MKKILNKHFAFFVLNISIPLICGVFVYLIFKPDAYISRLFYEVFSVQPIIVESDTIIIRFVSYYLCDMLWAYSLEYVVFYFVKSFSHKYLVSFLISFSFSVLLETFQSIGIMPGTFDLLDILVEGISIALALLCIKLFYWRNEHENNH